MRTTKFLNATAQGGQGRGGLGPKCKGRRQHQVALAEAEGSKRRILLQGRIDIVVGVMAVDLYAFVSPVAALPDTANVISKE